VCYAAERVPGAVVVEERLAALERSVGQ
jgi:hypothetical protein